MQSALFEFTLVSQIISPDIAVRQLHNYMVVDRLMLL